MFPRVCGSGGDERPISRGNACIVEVVIQTVARVLCLLFGCALPQDFHLFSVRLELSDVEGHSVFFACPFSMVPLARKVKALVPVCSLALVWVSCCVSRDLHTRCK